jgi:hypothetical protein
VQEAVERTGAVPVQEVVHSTGTVEYQQARTVMEPTAVGGNVKIEGNVAMASVDARDLAKVAGNRCDSF